MKRNEAKKQNTISISAAKAIGNNIDLLTEILLRLPVKPLVRCKCVSKQWLSLISHPQFCVSHNRHRHTQTPTALLLKKAYYSTPQIEMVPLKQDDTFIPTVSSFDYLNHPCFHIRQSCNGLFLCSSVELGSTFYYICNPTTLHFKRLSLPSSEYKKSFESVCMAFDPLKSIHYKLIYYVCPLRKTDNKYHIDMYSSQTDSWSLLGITFTPPNRVDFANPVFCNGAVHWYCREETSVYFDVDTECFNTMPMPNLSQRCYNHVVQYFGESQGHLHLIVIELPSPLQFDVLEMAADYSGWYVRYHVDLDAVRTVFPDLIWYRRNMWRFSVLDVIRAQKEEESIVVLFVDNKAISYNFHYGTSKKHCDLKQLPARGWSYYRWSDTFQYFESLTYV